MTTPMCPKCGSVTVANLIGGKRGEMVCMEDGCHHIDKRAKFMEGGPSGRPYATNTGWRDPVAMSMDGYDS